MERERERERRVCHEVRSVEAEGDNHWQLMIERYPRAYLDVNPCFKNENISSRIFLSS